MTKLLDEMVAFEDAMVRNYGYQPVRMESIAPDTHPEECYRSSRDCDRFVGWTLRVVFGSRPAGEPRNGEDLLNHCRKFEKLLASMHAAELDRTDALNCFITPEARAYVPHGLATLRYSIETAEKGMRGEQ